MWHIGGIESEGRGAVNLMKKTKSRRSGTLVLLGRINTGVMMGRKPWAITEPGKASVEMHFQAIQNHSQLSGDGHGCLHDPVEVECGPAAVQSLAQQASVG